ncbi:hypothetical protein HHK36_018330 [Tetracentron sinense]|uniref:Uso1/p115-like vesicle tethering protein C-terminal domain-containing protein n=1 Tax=Tetracentron sinense TaxID=13715 RepID=A0A835DAR0_TETSI|nr:hypothetical protein HHK36_018330 [Tetracentron sinense]
MDLVSSYKGVVGLVFGNENSTSSEDSYVERLLDRISNGVLAEDRRAAIDELQSVVAESRSAQLAFGAMGFPVLMGVLKEERDDIEMVLNLLFSIILFIFHLDFVFQQFRSYFPADNYFETHLSVRGALETLVSVLTPIDHAQGPRNEIQPALMNSDLLSREAESISLLLSLLSEEEFYVRYYTLQLLTALLTKSPNRLQEAILTIPHGITRLMDLLMDREVIRNEALLLLTYLTREAQEIQKIVVFEGAFEKIFSIIKEEGGSEGGVVVQDCLELLNNLVRNNVSNQILLRETLGFEPLVSILKLRSSAYSFTQQKTINLLSALDTIELLLMGGPEAEPGKDANRLTNQTVLAQTKNLDHLLMLGVESQWAAVAVRFAVLRVELEAPMASLGAPEPLMHRIVKYLALASSLRNKDGDYRNTSSAGNSGGDAFMVVDAISQKVGLTSYFLKFEEMQKSFLFVSAMPAQHHKPLTRSNAASMRLEADIRESIVEVFSHPKIKVAVMPAELEQKGGESDGDYIKRLKSFVEKQCTEMQDLLGRNATLAEDFAKTGEGGTSGPDKKASGWERVEAETLRRDLQEAMQRLEMLKSEKVNMEAEASMHQNLLEQRKKPKRREVELNDLLVCLRQEQSKVEKLSATLVELGEDVESLLEGVGDEVGDEVGLPEGDEDE